MSVLEHKLIAEGWGILYCYTPPEFDPCSTCATWMAELTYYRRFPERPLETGPVRFWAHDPDRNKALMLAWDKARREIGDG